jgi:hypothetical protein
MLEVVTQVKYDLSTRGASPPYIDRLASPASAWPSCLPLASLASAPAQDPAVLHKIPLSPRVPPT